MHLNATNTRNIQSGHYNHYFHFKWNDQLERNLSWHIQHSEQKCQVLLYKEKRPSVVKRIRLGELFLDIFICISIWNFR